jgi:hypothetical protein
VTRDGPKAEGKTIPARVHQRACLEGRAPPPSISLRRVLAKVLALPQQQ